MAVAPSDSAAEFKEHIKRIVERYKRTNREEYKLAVYAIRTKASTLDDPRFAQAKGSGNEMRAMYELPETLMTSIIRSLSTEGLNWFSTNKATRWFCKIYPEFRLPQEI